VISLASNKTFLQSFKNKADCNYVSKGNEHRRSQASLIKESSSFFVNGEVVQTDNPGGEPSFLVN